MRYKSITTVIPAYNEEECIGKSIDTIYEILEKTGRDFELIVADDGSTDSTYKIVMQKKNLHANLKIIREDRNRGRGSMLNKAFSNSKGDCLIYIDADLFIDPELFHEFIKKIDEGSDIVIGSKHSQGSNLKYPQIRKLVSIVYANFVEMLFKIGLKDFQCGLKCFTREVINSVLDDMANNGWFWDTEILIRSKWKGFKIYELPMKGVQIHKRKSRVHVLKDATDMGKSLLKFWITTKLRGEK